MRKVLKWIGIVLGAIVGLLVLAVVAVLVISGARINRRYDVAVESITIPTDETSIARGEYLVHAVAVCAACHGDNLAGKEFVNDPALGVIYTSNLTSGQGGVGATFSDEDWVRVLRHGVGPDGKSVIVMPSQRFTVMSDEDLGALLAYLKTVPPVDNVTPEPSLGPLGRVLPLMEPSVLPASVIDQDGPRPSAPEPGVNAEYGKYLVTLGTCQDCHGPDLNGAPSMEPGALPGANLTPGGELANWTVEEFVQTMHTGTTPDGRVLAGDMAEAVEYYGNQSDDDLAAIFAYLQTLPAMERGY
jgi:mono/diheme cytochrome c family protein